MRFCTFGLSLLLLLPSLARAQREILWRDDPQAAVAESQRTLKPLMVYVLSRTGDRDDRLDQMQFRALQDPRVVRLAERFVPLRLQRGQHRDALREFHLSESANQMMSFVTPEGDRLDFLEPTRVAEADALVQKLTAVLATYADRLFDTRIRATLENAEAKAAEISAALRLVIEWRVTKATRAVAALLDRERLDPGVRKAAIDALAALSTRDAAMKLLELARADDKAAALALERLTPPTAELLLAELKPEAEQFDHTLYRALAKIARLRDVRPAAWFEKRTVRERQQEVERLEKALAEAARRWRTENDAGR